jgi:hypothetical protein
MPTIVAVLALCSGLHAADFTLKVRQITSGKSNHFFGYIGHVQNIPWNGNGRYIVALRTSFQDRLPGPDDPADVILIDTRNDYSIRVVDQCRAWNPQQGTMLYWNPAAPDTQFFFNDRDTKTGKVFCVLFDLTKGADGGRVREYRFDETPVGNGGVAQKGGDFLAINYARMARLRPVTGYKGAFDWTRDVAHPDDDGIFKVNIDLNEKTLLVSFEQLAEVLQRRMPGAEIPPLFINHTLWNREGDRIFFFARGGWTGRGTKINQAFVMQPDGTHLTPLKLHIGGHPEWDFGHCMIGRVGNHQVIYDVDEQRVVDTLGSPAIFPDPEGDVALSPDGKWFVNGFKDRRARKNFYVVYRRADGVHVRSQGFDIGRWSGDLRQDPSPCWNRDGTQILVPALVGPEGTRQLFVIDVRAR